MYCCLQARSRSKKQVNKVPKGSEDHAKNNEHETRLSLRTAILSELGAENPHGAISAVAKLDASSHQSAVLNEPKVVNQHDATRAVAEQGSLPLQPAASSGPTVSKVDETMPTEAKMGRNLRTEAFQAIVNQGPLPLQTAVSGEPVGARRNQDLWNEAFTQLNDDKERFLSQVIVESHGLSVVEEIAEQTEQRFREHEQQGWKIPWGKRSESGGIHSL